MFLNPDWSLNLVSQIKKLIEEIGSQGFEFFLCIQIDFRLLKKEQLRWSNLLIY